MESKQFKNKKYFLLIFGLIYLVALKFLKLDHDIPYDITSYGAILTDEGWYSNSAIRFIEE